MNTEKTFVFNGVTYDTNRFLMAQNMFKKISLEESYIINPERPPFIDDAIDLPVVLQYEGKMIAVALPTKAVTKTATDTGIDYQLVLLYKHVRLVTKHNLKSYVHREPMAEARVEDLQRQRQSPRRDGFQSRPYQTRNGYSNRRYWYSTGMVAPIFKRYRMSNSER